MTNVRNRMGEERLQALLQESLAVATKTGAMKPSELSRVIVDTTVQPKNITFPTDAKLLNRAREKLVTLAKQLGVELRQSYTRVGKFALIQHQRYAHAKQFKRANRALRTLKTYLGRVIRDITRKIDGDHGLEGRFAPLLSTKTPRDTGSQTRDAPPLCRRARHRPSQGRAPNGPQLSCPPQRRPQQRHPCRRRLQLPPPHQVAEDFVAPHPDGALLEVKTIARLKTYCSQKTAEAQRAAPIERSTASLGQQS